MMLTLDPVLCWHLAHELHGRLTGARVNKVQQLSETAWLFHLWGGPMTNDTDRHQTRLLIDANKDHPFLCLLTDDQVKQLPQVKREQVSGFCMVLRKHLIGARIETVQAEQGDQVFSLAFRQTNDLGQAAQPVLVFECMGKHTNLILLDRPMGHILGLQARVTESMSRVRQLDTNLLYELPPRPAHKILVTQLDPEAFQQKAHEASATTPAQWLALLKLTAWGLNQKLVNRLIGHNPPGSAGDLLRVIQRFYLETPVGYHWSPSEGLVCYLEEAESAEPIASSLNTLVGQAFLSQSVNASVERLRERLRKPLNHVINFLEQEEALLAGHLDGQQRMLDWRQQGDALLTAYSMGSLTGARPIHAHMTLDDPVSGQPLTLTLDLRLDWTGNAQRLYKLAQKEQRRQRLALEKRDGVRDRLAQLTELALLLDQAETWDDLWALGQEWPAAGLASVIQLPKPSKHKPIADPSGKGILKRTLPDGTQIWIGRSGQGNAQLSGKLARSTDWWFHVRQMPGSHVLVKPATPGGDLPPALIELAAQLAVYYSVARAGAKVPVIYTQARFVRHIPNSWPGHVNYTQEQSLFTTANQDQIEAFLSPA